MVEGKLLDGLFTALLQAHPVQHLNFEINGRLIQILGRRVVMIINMMCPGSRRTRETTKPTHRNTTSKTPSKLTDGYPRFRGRIYVRHLAIPHSR